MRAVRRTQPEQWAQWETSGATLGFHPLRWTFVRAGVVPGEIVATIVLDGRIGRARLLWRMGRTCGEASAGLVVLPRRIGGPRWYWTCPVTGHRTERLYLVDGMGPASRQAHGLVYACQRETPRERAARRARKLRRHLGEALPVVGGRVPDQPPRMTPRVYGRLVDAVRAAEAQALAAIGP